MRGAAINPESRTVRWQHRPANRRGGARPLPVYVSVRRRQQLLAVLGENVRAYRHALGCTQAALAAAAWMSTPTLSRIERGIREPAVLSALLLARALGCSMDDLFSGDRGSGATPSPGRRPATKPRGTR